MRGGRIECVISNQSAIARGFLREADLPRRHDILQRELLLSGARIDRIDNCPRHPADGKPPYNIVCECRTPAAGMLRRGEADLGIDVKQSFVVGDRIVDVQPGKAVDFILQRIHGTHG